MAPRRWLVIGGVVLTVATACGGSGSDVDSEALAGAIQTDIYRHDDMDNSYDMPFIDCVGEGSEFTCVATIEVQTCEVAEQGIDDCEIELTTNSQRVQLKVKCNDDGACLWEGPNAYLTGIVRPSEPA
jgi:hypothetical protein